jgi:Predicted NTPase (NACHT family)
MLRIIHLSDLHINKSQQDNFESYCIPALIKDLTYYNSKDKIDLIVFSGDIIDKGGSEFDSLIDGLNYFKNSLIAKLSESLELSPNNIFFAPGNHDIDRDADESFVDLGLITHLNSEDAIDEFIKRNRTSGIDRIIDFKNFEKEFYKDYTFEKELTNFQSTFITNIKGLNVGISCFNTAWRCYDSNTDKGKLLLGEKQITDSKKLIDKCHVKLAISHHFFDYLVPFDSKYCEPAIKNTYDLLMLGHVHEGSNSLQTDMYGNIFITTAPSNWTSNLRSDSRDYANGYSIIDYDLDNEKVIIHSRRYNHKKRGYDPNTDIGDNFGIKEYNIPTPEEKKNSKYRQDLCNKLFQMHKEDMNQHLLSYSNQIDAPKDIEELFVNPRLRDRKNLDVSNPNDKIITINEIYETDKNFIILGQKESGKTLLLDKLVIEYIKAINRLNKIPIYINYNDIGNKRIEQMINNYLGIGIKDVKTLLETHKLVLLIDDLTYTNSRKLSTLIDFIEKNNVQVIVCSNTTLQGYIDPELFSYKLFTEFTIVFLEPFNSRQIKELAQKWFYNDKEYEKPGKVKKIVNTLISLNLPRTPLAISMFLWILNQQNNNKPKNYAAMLQNFIEKLFEKTSVIDVFSQDFDYTNKLILLTEIAYEMYNKNEDNYRMQYIELINFIHDYLIKKKFEFNCREVLDDFIFRGILVTEFVDNIQYVFFRYNCFFSYMLMNKMDIDPDFLEFTLFEDNYLKFVQEIDYFTALKRTRSDILINIFGKLNDVYSEKLIKLENENFDFDSINSNLDDTLLVDTIDPDMIGNIDTKPTDSQVNEIMDTINDNAFEEIASDKQVNIKVKSDETTDLQRMDRVLFLASKLLKNTEETTVNNLKYDSYVQIVKCFMYYYKEYFEYIRIHGKVNADNFDFSEIYIKFAPIITQVTLYYTMGTSKLKTVIREKITNDMIDPNVSDYERFVSIFLYADMQENDFLKYVTQFMKTLKHRYIKDMILVKLMFYYIFYSKNKESDKLYVNKIAELLKDSCKTSKQGNNMVSKFDKNITMNNLKKLKEDTLTSTLGFPLL